MYRVRLHGLGLLAAVALASVPAALASQTARCKDGTYSYSAHRRGTCSHHRGVAEWLSPSTAPQPPARADSAQTTQPATSEPPWVASSQGHTYYQRGCSTANRLSPANRIYFKTEGEAQQAGYQRSRSRGC